MIKNRYVTIPIDEELVARWWIGLSVLGTLLAYEVELHKLDGWPELAHAEREAYGWRLVFVWRDQAGHVQ
jgi:hypothetical protein